MRYMALAGQETLLFEQFAINEMVLAGQGTLLFELPKYCWRSGEEKA